MAYHHPSTKALLVPRAHYVCMKSTSALSALPLQAPEQGKSPRALGLWDNLLLTQLVPGKTEVEVSRDLNLALE